MPGALDLERARIPELRTELPGPNAKQIIERDDQFVSPSYTRSYPLVVKRGSGAMLEDVDGNVFLDFNAGVAVCVTGHAHPRVVEAITNQIHEFVHISGTDYYYPHLPALAEKLNRLVPGNFEKKTHFGNSGAEAVEGAIKLAMYTTRRQRLVGFYGAFHGRTLGALSLTASKSRQRAGFGRQALDVTHIPYAYCYRCPYSLTRETCGAYESRGPHCARVIEDLLFKTTIPAEECAAIVVEPIQGEGGYIVPPDSFLDDLARDCRSTRRFDDRRRSSVRNGSNRTDVCIRALRIRARYHGDSKRDRLGPAFERNGRTG